MQLFISEFQSYGLLLASNTGNSFPYTLVFGIAIVVVLLLVLAGVLIIKSNNTESQDFASRYEQSITDAEDPPAEVLENVEVPTWKKKSAETVDNDGDDFEMDKSKKRFASQGTVDANRDLSVSADEDLDDANLSSQPTVDSTGDISVSSDEEE